VRETPAVDGRSGVSAGSPSAAAESGGGRGAPDRADRRKPRDETPVARVGDLPGIVPTLRGQVEFEVRRGGREERSRFHLLRRAIAETSGARLGGAT